MARSTKGLIISLILTLLVLINGAGAMLNAVIGIELTNQTLDTNMSKTIKSNLEIPLQSLYKYQPYLTLTGSKYLDISDNETLELTKFSIALWFRTTIEVPFRSNAYIVNKGGFGSDKNGTNLNYGIWMTSSESIRSGFEDSSGVDYFVESPKSANRYNLFQWHYVISTYDGSTLRLYIDGLPIGTKFVGMKPDNSTMQPVRIGANSFAPNGFFTGNIDEIRIWNRPLAEKEIADAYSYGIFNTKGMIIYLPF